MKKTIQLLALFILLVGFSACKTNEKSSATAEKCILPIWLNFDNTEFIVTDFAELDEIDSVTIENQKQTIDKLGKFIFITPENAPNLMIMNIWTNDKSISVVLKKSLKQLISFTFDPKGKIYKKVQLKGEFNAWNPSATNLTFDNGVWKTSILVGKGKYQYLVVADDKEMLDDANPNKIDNNKGGFNSLLIIGENETNQAPNLLSESFKDDEIILSATNSPTKIYVLWNNTKLDNENAKYSDGKIIIHIPDEAKSHYRSFIRAFSSNSTGISNDILIPLSEGNVITDVKELDRNDRQTNILYNTFVDRFYDGDPSNNRLIKGDSVLPKANYYGGDVTGILKKINEGYFDELGVNTLWISPLVKNPEKAYGEWKDPYTKFSGYHGYWPISFTIMDDRLSTPDEFKNLVESAHHKKMNVLVDFVAHHIHNTHPYFIAHPDCCTPLILPDGTRNLERWDDHRLTTWFDTFLPTLNLEKPEIANMVADSAVWWIKEYGIDGFRHDAAKHVPLSFWHLLTQKLQKEIVSKENRPVYQLGETYGSVDLINSYIGSNLLDAQFDFNVYDAAVGCFAAGKPFNVLRDRLFESNLNYGSHNTMGYITGNQDRGRFISYASGDLKFDEDAKAAGWQREIVVSDPIGYQRLSMLMAFNMTIPGLPVIYYGDEFGVPGGNDPDCRRMMWFGAQLNEKEKQNLEITKKLTRIRSSNMSLIYGDFCLFNADQNTLVYARKYFENIVIVAFNNSKEEKTITIDVTKFSNIQFISNFGTQIQKTNNQIVLKLKGNSFEILSAK